MSNDHGERRQNQAAPRGLLTGLPSAPQGKPWVEWMGSAVFMVALAVAMALAAYEARAQARPIGASPERIEQINETVATAPHIDGDQLQTVRPVATATNPSALVSSYVRHLEQYANGAGSAKPVDVKSPAEAAWLLGLMQLHGAGTGINPLRARDWFQHAQRLHYPLAPAGLAWCLMDGCGQQPQPEAARAWIAQLRKPDPGRALYLEWSLAQLLSPLQVATPTNPEVRTRQPSALLLRAAKAGDTYGENELGIYHAGIGNLSEAKRLFQLAATTSPAAKANMAWVDRQHSANAVIPSVNAGDHGQPLFLRARQFHRGDGVPVNYGEALRLYREAAAKGNRPAQKMLALIYTRPTPTGELNIVWMQQLAPVDVTKEGGTTMMEPPPSPSLQQDPTPLYDYLPARLRTPSTD